MKIKELKAIAKVMDECGIVFLKTAEVELHRETGNKVFPVEQRPVKKESIPVPFETSITEKETIPHKTIELESVMKLSDTELVDKLFPDFTTEEAEAS